MITGNNVYRSCSLGYSSYSNPLPAILKTTIIYETLLTLNILLFLLISCADRPAQKHIESGTKEINGTQLYYKTIGKGEPILIVHGGPGLNYNFLLPHLSTLAENYQLIFYHQRDCGKSSLNIDISFIAGNNFIEDIAGILNPRNFTKPTC